MKVSWGYTCQIRILVKYKNLDAGEDLLTTTKSPYQIPTNLERWEIRKRRAHEVEHGQAVVNRGPFGTG